MITYNQIVEQHFFEPRNVASSLELKARQVLVTLGHESLGARATLILGCDEDETINCIKYRVYGNPYLIAALSVCSSKYINEKISVLNEINSQEFIDLLSIPKTKRYVILFVSDLLNQASKLWWKQYGKK